MDKEIIDVTGLAIRWKVTSKHIYDLVSEGTIPYFKVGRSVRFRTDLIENFEKGNLLCDNETKIRSNITTGLQPDEQKESIMREKLHGINPNLIRYIQQAKK